MKQAVFLQTDRGFVLRQSVGYRIVEGLLSLFMIGCGMFICIRSDDPGTVSRLLDSFMGLVVAGCGLWNLVCNVGRTLVLDENGIHHKVWGIPVRHMAWTQVADWRIIKRTKHGRYGASTRYYLIFSSEQGKTSGWSCIRLEISDKERMSFRRSLLRRYILARLGQEDEFSEYGGDAESGENWDDEDE